MDGLSARCYYAEGPFAIVATLPNGARAMTESGASSVTVKTDANGIARLNLIPTGKSVYAWNTDGVLTVTASVGGATIGFSVRVGHTKGDNKIYPD